MQLQNFRLSTDGKREFSILDRNYIVVPLHDKSKGYRYQVLRDAGVRPEHLSFAVQEDEDPACFIVGWWKLKFLPNHLHGQNTFTMDELVTIFGPAVFAGDSRIEQALRNKGGFTNA